MSIFGEHDGAQIERFSAGLSPAEVLDIWCVRESELSQDDLDFFERSYRKGRAMAKGKAVDALFLSMNGRDGVKGALSYLTRVGDEWPEVTEDKTKPRGAFNIVLPG